MKGKNAILGAVFGLLIGGPAILLSWATIISQRDSGIGIAFVWLIGWMVWGAILGLVLLRKKA
ncbi:MAG: hypothetical protein HY340_03435 [Candidatus Kerfeldbacteria bacterium]|nr:hypothetical protein [Candidatus Kerfeldbacteria bacterium]